MIYRELRRRTDTTDRISYVVDDIVRGGPLPRPRAQKTKYKTDHKVETLHASASKCILLIYCCPGSCALTQIRYPLIVYMLYLIDRN